MRQVSRFSPLPLSAFSTGVFLVVFLAGGLVSQTQAASPTDQMEIAATDGEVTPVAMEAKKKEKGQMSPEELKAAQKEKGDCDGPPGSCYSTAVAQGNGWGCNQGSMCISEGMNCGMGRCTTVNGGGTCYCSCR